MPGAGRETVSGGLESAVRRCFFAPFDERNRPCEGPEDAAHLLSKQWLKRAGVEDVWDTRLWVSSCRRHHAAFDQHQITVPRQSLPAGLLAASDEFGLGHLLDRRYGP